LGNQASEGRKLSSWPTCRPTTHGADEKLVREKASSERLCRQTHQNYILNEVSAWEDTSVCAQSVHCLDHTGRLLQSNSSRP